jgi:ABC-type dipeptide/oligopeptide/nickel transport system permease subunit
VIFGPELYKLVPAWHVVLWACISAAIGTTCGVILGWVLAKIDSRMIRALRVPDKIT